MVPQTERLEVQIAEIAQIVNMLAKTRQKNRLRLVLTELAKLKAKRSIAVIAGLDLQNGIGDELTVTEGV